MSLVTPPSVMLRAPRRTGGTLSVWLAAQAWAAARVSAIVLVSPAFALRKPEATVYLVLKWVVACCPQIVSMAIINAAVGREHFIQVLLHGTR